MSQPEPLFGVVGPTGTGKSALALDLAERIGGEIISVDSGQIFIGLDIGTAKPTPEERARVPHHLIDVVGPNEQWSAASFAEAADRAIQEIRARGRVPILCGGTGLWLRALIHGIFTAPPIDPEIRRSVRSELDERGAAAVHAELARVDPEAASRLHPNDAQRIGRALEVYRQTEVPISRLQAEHGFRAVRHRLLAIAIDVPPEVFEPRLKERTRAMYALGWIDEVRSLLAAGVDPHGPGLSVIGYRDVVLHVEGRLSREEAEAETALATRRYARRQRGWFRGETTVEWLPVGVGADEAVAHLKARETSTEAH
jgi:tRNA dimethylallyltransferase